MYINLKNNFLKLWLAFFPFVAFAENITTGNKYRAQDINVKTSLCQDYHFCPYIESNIGYRHDILKNTLKLYDALWEIDGWRKEKVDLMQLNFKAGAVIYKYVFIKGNIGYAFVNKNQESEASYLKGTDFLINAYDIDLNAGHAFDGLIGGGVRIPIYEDYAAFDAEIGYDYKKINLTEALITRISSPYVGGTLYGSLYSNLQLALYGSYFFDPAAQESANLYLVKAKSFTQGPGFYTNHHISAYKVGANLSYMFTDHLSLDLNWERFSGKTGLESGSYDINILGNIDEGDFEAKLNYWISNQYVIGLRYSF